MKPISVDDRMGIIGSIAPNMQRNNNVQQTTANNIRSSSRVSNSKIGEEAHDMNTPTIFNLVSDTSSCCFVEQLQDSKSRRHDVQLNFIRRQTSLITRVTTINFRNGSLSHRSIITNDEATSSHLNES